MTTNTSTSQTIQSYEDYADRYAANVSKTPSNLDRIALKCLAQRVGPGGRVLEIGSGPGYEADFMETLGLDVKRTDATKRFLEIQAARGKQGDLLDIITDEFGGPYDAVVGMCVLIHVPREHIDSVLAKITNALRPGGLFLVSMREGDGETTGKYHTIYWRRDDFAARINAAGMDLLWDQASVCEDGDNWNTFLAARPS